MPYAVTVSWPEPGRGFTRTRSTKQAAETMATELRAKYKGTTVTVTPTTPEKTP